MVNSEKNFSNAYLLGYFVANMATFGIVLYYLYQRNFNPSEWMFITGVITLWMMIIVFRKEYVWPINKSYISRSYSFAKSYFILLILVVTFFYLLEFPIDFGNVLLAFLLGIFFMGITTKFFIDLLVNLLHKKFTHRRVAVVADTDRLTGFKEKQLKLSNYYNTDRNFIKSFVKSKKEISIMGAEKIIDSVKEMDSYLQNNQIDQIIITLPLKTSKKTKEMLTLADYYGVRVKYLIDYENTFGSSCKITKYGKLDVLNLRQHPLDERYSAFLKSTFDFLFSSVVLLLLIPVFLVIAVLIKIDSPGTIFYCPIRVGKGGKPIKIFKFRTMTRNDSAQDGTLSTQENDPRISKLGRILRKSSLDELPQFINVFLGDMSVVGPRPHRISLNRVFQECEHNYMIRHYLKPGITGWAQVNGWRGPTETKEQKHQRTLHDLWYLENWSFILDVKIIVLTLFGKKTRKNVF